jgi:hypothetical protein
MKVRIDIMNHKRVTVLAASLGLLILALSTAGCGHTSLQSDPTAAGTKGRAHALVSQHVISMLDGNTVNTTEFFRESPYIDWVGNANNNTIGPAKTAGMKTFWYTEISRLKSTDPLYGQLAAGDFAYTCTHVKVYAYAPGEQTPLYLTDPSSAHLRYLYETSGKFDGMADAISNGADAIDYDAAAKWADLQTPPPCHAPSYSVQWTRQDWIGASAQFLLQSAQDTHYGLGPNGLSTAMGYNGLDVLSTTGKWETPGPQFASDIAAGTTPPSTTGLDAGGGFGGRDEGCYGPGGFRTQYTDRAYGNEWISYENTEILVGLIDNVRFICMYGYGLADTGQAVPGRMYGFASYVLTYNPQTDILFDAFADSNTDQGDPEEQLVFLNPIGVSNSNLSLISSLAEPGGYGREYSSCYQNGILIGKCAVVVNPNKTGSMNWPFTGYTRTLTLNISANGGTIVNGGSATIGSPAPTAVGPGSAEIGYQ